MFLGHEFQLNYLRQAWRSGRLFHANLFVGPESIGKKAVAEEIVRMIIGAESDFNLIESPNVKLLGYENSVGIDDIRDLKKFFQFRPFGGKDRAVILDNVHILGNEPANAFLKLLEEPPQDSYFFLIATSEKKVPQTIVSRCSLTRFSQISKAGLADWLKNRKKLSLQKSLQIAEIALGRPGLALRLADDFEAFNSKINNLKSIIRGEKIFQWPDWEKSEANGLTLDFLSQISIHQVLGDNGNYSADFVQMGQKVVETESITANTNANPRLAWENIFWKLT